MIVKDFKKPEFDGGASPFNFIVDTNQRCSEILRQITAISITPLFDDVQRQIMKVNLVKEYFLNSCVLMKKDTAESFREVLKLKPIEKSVMKVKSGIQHRYKGFYFDEELEHKLDDYLYKMQRAMQEESKLFMPSSKDPKFGWGQG